VECQAAAREYQRHIRVDAQRATVPWQTRREMYLRAKRQLRKLIDDGWPRPLLSRELGFAGGWLPIYSQARKFEARTASKVERLARRIEGGYLQRLA
jgi:hypothetical protein